MLRFSHENLKRKKKKGGFKYLANLKQYFFIYLELHMTLCNYKAAFVVRTNHRWKETLPNLNQNQGKHIHVCGVCVNFSVKIMYTHNNVK